MMNEKRIRELAAREAEALRAESYSSRRSRQRRPPAR